jgi:hypothetical protein
MSYLREDLLSGAALMAAMAAGMTGIAILVFGWTLSEIAASAAVGTVAWAIVSLLFERRKELPRGVLPTAPDESGPEGEPLATDRLWGLKFALFSAALAFALTWFVDLLIGPQGYFIPGQFAGYAVAKLAAAAVVLRWERRHGARVVQVRAEEDEDDDQVELFAYVPDGRAAAVVS